MSMPEFPDPLHYIDNETLFQFLNLLEIENLSPFFLNLELNKYWLFGNL